VKDPRLHRADRRSGRGGDLGEREPLAEEKDRGGAVLGAERSQRPVEVDRDVAARRGRRLNAVERCEASASSDFAAQPVGAFAMQDAECLGRKLRRLGEQGPAAANARPSVLHRFTGQVVVLKDATGRADQARLPARREALAGAPVA
jgi:hypothetical protein